MEKSIVGNLSSQIYRSLRQDILAGKIGLGEKLINKALQERFGVSSTPIRDAINRLYQDGLVEEISNVGAQVISFDLAFALEVNEILSILSGAALRMCDASARREEMEADIEKLLKEMRGVQTKDAYIAVDRLVHILPFQYCGNAQLCKLHEKYHALAEMIVQNSFKIPKELDILERHAAYLQAFQAGDMALASAKLQEHYAISAEELRRVAAGLGMYTDL